MAKQYQWRTTFTYHNQLDPDFELTYGVTPTTYNSWQTATPGESETITVTYFYHDSNTKYAGKWSDTVSTQVNFSVTQVWTTTIDSRNNLNVSVTTTVNSIDRLNAQGGDQNTPGRTIQVFRQQGGTAYINYHDTQVATNHSISGSVSLGTYTFTLAPGQNLTRNTLYIHNQTDGSSSFDDIWAGVQFRNPLPADYRPGATLKTDNPYYPGDQTGVWLSHNKSDGAAHVLSSVEPIVWQEMRTIDGDSGGQGNPPLILHQDDANSWYNQQLLGKD